MTRHQLEHILRAAGAITDEREIVVLGSQAILGSFPDAPPELCQSMEADAFPMHNVEKADLIDGTIGELSPFHETHGYYAHGITPESATLAEGWRERLVRLQSPATGDVVGHCLSPADLAVSKLAAGRDKDIAFVSILIARRFVPVPAIENLAATLPPAARE
ncbi:MAG: DUF6036 family nucleotidyltransferase, partial [Kiritimatiellia bacterium]